MSFRNRTHFGRAVGILFTCCAGGLAVFYVLNLFLWGWLAWLGAVVVAISLRKSLVSVWPVRRD